MARFPVFSLLALWIALYYVVRPRFIDSRDGSLGRVGKGQEQEWVDISVPFNMRATMTWLPLSDSAIHMLEGDSIPRLSFILIHDLAEHSGALRDVGHSLAEQCAYIGSVCNIYAVMPFSIPPISQNYKLQLCRST